MKKLIVALIPVIIIVVSALLVLNFTILKENKVEKGQIPVGSNISSENKGRHSCCPGEDKGEISDNSIYQLNSIWKNQEGQPVSLKSFAGKPVILTMFFANCSYACPLLVNDMQKMESLIPEGKRNDYRFILVSIDPERDTPAKLKIYANEHKLDLSRWALLTGSNDHVMELAVLTGFKYKKDDNGNYSHSNLITLLNQQGEIVHQQTGLNQDITESVSQIKKL